MTIELNKELKICIESLAEEKKTTSQELILELLVLAFKVVDGNLWKELNLKIMNIYTTRKRTL